MFQIFCSRSWFVFCIYLHLKYVYRCILWNMTTDTDLVHKLVLWDRTAPYSFALWCFQLLRNLSFTTQSILILWWNTQAYTLDNSSVFFPSLLSKKLVPTTVIVLSWITAFIFMHVWNELIWYLICFYVTHQEIIDLWEKIWSLIVHLLAS